MLLKAALVLLVVWLVGVLTPYDVGQLVHVLLLVGLMLLLLGFLKAREGATARPRQEDRSRRP
jgi:hypothetical protein